MCLVHAYRWILEDCFLLSRNLSRWFLSLRFHRFMLILSYFVSWYRSVNIIQTWIFLIIYEYWIRQSISYSDKIQLLNFVSWYLLLYYFALPISLSYRPYFYLNFYVLNWLKQLDIKLLNYRIMASIMLKIRNPDIF